MRIAINIVLLVVGVAFLVWLIKTIFNKIVDFIEDPPDPPFFVQVILDFLDDVKDWILGPVTPFREAIEAAFARIDKSHEERKKRRNQDYEITTTEIHYADGSVRFPERENKKSVHLPHVIFALCSLLFSAIVIFFAIRADGGDVRFVEGAFLESLPIYAIINMIINGAITYEGVVQMVLFNILAIFLMRKNHFGHPFPDIVFDLIYTVFCTALVYVIPDALYPLPIKLFHFFLDGFTGLGENWFLNILRLLLFGAALLFSLYVAAACLVVTIREIAYSVAFSLFPLILVLIAVVYLTSRSWDPWIINTGCYAVTILSTVWVCYARVHYED